MKISLLERAEVFVLANPKAECIPIHPKDADQIETITRDTVAVHYFCGCGQKYRAPTRKILTITCRSCGDSTELLKMRKTETVTGKDLGKPVKILGVKK